MDHLLIDAPRLGQQLFLLTQCLHIQAGVIIPPSIDHLIDAPQLSQQLFLLTQGLHIQAGVMIILFADCLLSNTHQLSQQLFSLAQDLHIRVYSVDHLLDIPCRGHHICRRAPRSNNSCSDTPVQSHSYSDTHSSTPESRYKDKPMNRQTNPSKLGFHPPSW